MKVRSVALKLSSGNGGGDTVDAGTGDDTANGGSSHDVCTVDVGDTSWGARRNAVARWPRQRAAPARPQRRPSRGRRGSLHACGPAPKMRLSPAHLRRLRHVRH